MILYNLFNLIYYWTQFMRLILAMIQYVIIVTFDVGMFFFQFVSVASKSLFALDIGQAIISSAVATTTANSEVNAIFSIPNIFSFILLGGLIYIIAMLSNLGKKHKDLTDELNNLKGGLEKVEKKVLDSEGKRQDGSSRNRFQAKNLGESASYQPGTPRHHNKSLFTQKKDDSESSTEVSQFQTASTILSSTYIIENSKEQKKLEEMLLAYRAVFDTLHFEDIRDFCKQYKVFSTKRYEHSNSDTALELVDELCGDSNLWAILHVNDIYYILPGTTIRTSFKNLTTDNSRTIGEVFKGIMLIMPSTKFELMEPAVAEKRNNMLVITKQGKFGVPLGTNKR